MRKLTALLLALALSLAAIPAFAEAGGDSLAQFLYALSPQADMASIESQGKSAGLYVNSRMNGIGGREYRISASKETADLYSPAKGSYITLTFDLLDGDALKAVTYFEERRMISAFWTKNEGYTMIDYNDPAGHSGRVPMDSFAALQGYVPSAASEDNLLEMLFLHITDGISRDRVLSAADKAGLSYNPRGAGNESYITFDPRVREKYGDDGTYLIIDFTDDCVSRLEYHDYVASYWQGSYAAFYTQSYAYNDYSGFYVVNSQGEAIPVDSARAAIDAVQADRLSAQIRLGYAG